MNSQLEIHHTMGRRIIGVEISETNDTPREYLVTFCFDDGTYFSLHTDYRFLRCAEDLPRSVTKSKKQAEKVVYCAGIS